ncbi:MAG: M1 family metallopeptidase, partial [Phycisphaerae bacterium]
MKKASRIALVHTKPPFLAMAALLTIAFGCARPQLLSVQATRYDLNLHLDPPTHTLSGTTAIELRRTDDEPMSEGRPIAVKLALHPALKLLDVSDGSQSLDFRVATRGDFRPNAEFKPTAYYVYLPQPVDTTTLTVTAEGPLEQDVQAGEKAGAIHNFSMRAHIGEEGVYLAGGSWYPQPVAKEDQAPTAADFSVAIDPVPDMALAVSADRDPRRAGASEPSRWHTAYPIDHLAVVGGPHEVHTMEYDGVSIALHLKASQAQHRDGLMETVQRILDRYQPLLGAYPAKDFTIVDNFFSSGFAFPTFTLLSSAVIDMGERSQTAHGYIDHEMLHCWWGNGVLVDERDGNWCESLTSYFTNYYGYVLDDAPEEARRKRRNYSHFLSRLKPEHDKPLGTFGLKDGCGRGIAYNKGAAVFHMLARKMGQDAFFAAMRRFSSGYVGRYADWAAIRRACEAESGLDLERFFDDWVHGSGAPTLSADNVVYDSSVQALTLTLSQGETAMALDVPIRLLRPSGSEDITVALSQSKAEVRIEMAEPPLSIQIDPDYHIFRKVSIDEIIPTTNKTRAGDALLTLLPDGEVCKKYTSVQSIFESSFEDDEHGVVAAADINEAVLSDQSLLILGSAVHHPAVEELLDELGSEIAWTSDGFTFDGVEYSDPGDAILCTFANPKLEKGGITVVYANSEEAIPKPMNIPFYDRSLVIFQ